MSTQPLFTIITVVRNNKNGIIRTINSVLDQDYKNYEYIIIDGESTDGTLEIINSFSNKIDVVISEKDNGIYDAMNKGIIIAKGQFIAFLNSGDWYEKNTLTLVSNILNDNKQIDILHGLLVYYNKNLEFEYILGDNSISIPYRMIQHPSTFVRSKLYKENLYDLKYKSASDYNTFLIFYFNKYNFLFSPFIFTHFVNDGISQNIKSRIETIEIKRKYKLISIRKYVFLKIYLTFYNYFIN